jgi:hypothetical protein
VSASPEQPQLRPGRLGPADGRRSLQWGPDWSTVLLRLSYLAVSSVLTVMRLLPMSDTTKDVKILALRHQLTILQRQIHTPRLTGTDRAFLHRDSRRSSCGSYN